ncbi:MULTISPECIES: HEAT repeat domain-containing protein [unclassified Synechocystis]|uniref:HEAT repeat domain-containing protein n=1 Tax=unclassified Synechocystis TaxID=2640012 RepID=UPI0003F7CAD0|nr:MULTISPECIES: HEAT repeat domain-containing protein [unclassified Synechocystis]AIE76033.1 Phycocyanobilin lyase beta subunit [Synechocystis sp. PCC 6714]MCT0255061.1 HEAT repeat domain-containing protein [Synechocystis sp. CS-94]
MEGNTATAPEIEQLIQAVETADSAEKLVGAVRALAATRSPLAVPPLTTVLRYNNPGAAVAAVDGLIEIGDAAMPHLLANMDGYNYGARAWATRACAGIGDPRALELLQEAALTDFALSVRRAAAKGLGFLRWQTLPPEEQGNVQKIIYETLIKVCADPEWVVRYGAIAGLENLAKQAPHYHQPLRDFLRSFVEQEPEAIVKERINWALENIAQA